MSPTAAQIGDTRRLTLLCAELPAVLCGSSSANSDAWSRRVNPGWDDPSGVFYATMFADSDLKGMRELMRKYPMSGHLVDGLTTPWTAEGFYHREHDA